ncbi:MAG: adenylosuccinate lyase [Actinobacteria bacterium]|nr:MAG: adenylosuccinate lyase [Actinomycetota bacterium]
MIERYSRPQMKAIWSEHNKFSKWMEIEVLASEAQAELGVIPKEAAAEIRAKAGFDVERIDEIEAEVHHDVIAFVSSMAETIGEAGRWVHYGMTSYDVVDNGLSVRMVEAADLLIEDVTELVRVLKERALEHKDTVMVGRTHGIQAEPMVFGLKPARWAFEMKRNLERLREARETVRAGKVSGAVGTYSNIDPFVEEYVCEKLGLKPAEVSTQVLGRDRHAAFMTALAVVASSLDQIATEIRSLQRTEILEVEEPFESGQKGSSAMPHKRNPVICERVCGLARVIRANAQAALEDVSLWNERDISHSSVERVIVPDSCIALDYILAKMTYVMRGLVVYPANMIRNLELTGGLVFSSRVLLELVEKGVSREEAYGLVQRNAMAAWRGEGKFRELLAADEEVSKLLSAEELEECFDPAYYLRNTAQIFERLEEL